MRICILCDFAVFVQYLTLRYEISKCSPKYNTVRYVPKISSTPWTRRLGLRCDVYFSAKCRFLRLDENGQLENSSPLDLGKMTNHIIRSVHLDGHVEVRR